MNVDYTLNQINSRMKYTVPKNIVMCNNFLKKSINCQSCLTQNALEETSDRETLVNRKIQIFICKVALTPTISKEYSSFLMTKVLVCEQVTVN